MKLHIQMAC